MPRDGAIGRTLSSCQGLFPLPVLNGAFPAHPLARLLLELATSTGVSVGHSVPVSPPEQVPAVGLLPVAGLGPAHTYSLQVLGALAELCQQLLPSLSALRLMFEQHLSHPSLWELSSKQIAGGGGIYLRMTGLQSIYSTGNCSLLKCQIDSSSCTGCGASTS